MLYCGHLYGIFERCDLLSEFLTLHQQQQLNGNNLLCFDGIKIVDPESEHLGASSYPTQRGLTLGLQIGF